MSEQPKKRPWLQFHLSTAVVLMFVAGGLLWLNMHENGVVVVDGQGQQSGLGIGFECRTYGWPLTAYRGQSGRLSPFGGVSSKATSHYPILQGYYYGRGLGTDAAVAFAVLLATGILCEFIVSRRDRRP
jgi:hypothetical protein